MIKYNDVMMLKMLLQYLNLDCLSSILSKVSYVDNISFRLTCKVTKNIPLPSFKDIFIKRILEHNIVPSYEVALKFCDNLYETGAYVAGSFILDCLYDTNHHQDIDIYDQTDPIDKYLYHNSMGQTHTYYKLNDSFNEFGDNNLKFTQSLYEMGFKSIGEGMGPDLILRSFVHTSNKNFVIIKDNVSYFGKDKLVNKFTTHSIQIIPIGLKLREKERSFIPRFISASFDLEICQSIFDGRILHIKNINKILNKYDYIKPNTRFMLHVYPQDDNEEKTLTMTRMSKYIERGFDIKTHPKYNEIEEFVSNTLKSNKYSIDNRRYQYNIKYIDNDEIDLSKYDF